MKLQYDPKISISPADFVKLCRYKEVLEERAVFDSDDVFPNKNEYHASIVLTTMLQHAKHRFCMFDDTLDGDLSEQYDIFGEFLPALEQFILLGRRFQLVVLTRPNPDCSSGIYRKLKELAHLPNVHVQIASKQFIANIAKEFGDLRFAVADNKMFRYETVKGERRAFCSFNHHDYSRLLETQFDAQLKTCPPLFVTQG